MNDVRAFMSMLILRGMWGVSVANNVNIQYLKGHG